MSDLLEDQIIHNIVKDYKRMYEQHDQLIKIGKQLQEELITKDKELLRVRTELNDLKAKRLILPNDKPLKDVKGQLGVIETRANSIAKNIEIATERINGIKDNIKQIREQLKI